MSSQQALASAAGIATRTASALERGDIVRPGTLVAIERALDWEPGSADAILSGGDPRLREQPEAPTTESDPRVSDEIRAELLGKTHRELLRMRQYWALEAGEAAADRWLEWVLQMRDDAARPTHDVG